MSTVTRLPRRFVDTVNARVVALRDHPRWGRWARRHVAIVTYTGRRSGRMFSLPVAYRRSGDTVTIGVGIPDAKSWWRNFHGDGAPIRLELDGAVHSGHAVARREGRGSVMVTVRLDSGG